MVTATMPCSSRVYSLTPHYISPNTLRTNVQYEAEGICTPPSPD